MLDEFLRRYSSNFRRVDFQWDEMSNSMDSSYVTMDIDDVQESYLSMELNNRRKWVQPKLRKMMDWFRLLIKIGLEEEGRMTYIIVSNGLIDLVQ